MFQNIVDGVELKTQVVEGVLAGYDMAHNKKGDATTWTWTDDSVHGGM